MREKNSGFWAAASVLFGLIALCRGARLPGPWALSQLQITYVHGLVKRGLLGQLLYSAHVRSLHSVIACCWLEQIAFVVLLAVFTWKSGLLSEQRNPAVVAAFAAGYAVTFFAHLAGYHDVVLYLLGVAVVLIWDLRWRFVFAVPVCIAALLIHELFLFAVLPVILFSFLAERGGRSGKKYALGLLALSVVVTVVVTLGSSLSPQAFAVFQRETLARASYPVDVNVFSVLRMSTLENLRLNAHVIRSYWWWWAELGVILFNMGPLLVLLLYCGIRQTGGFVRWAFVGASLAPLLLNLLGWDSVRWACLCTLTSYINLGLLTRATPSKPGQASRFVERCAILLIGVGLASGYGLMDGAKVRPYPFFPPLLRHAIVRHDGALGYVF